ncbi:phage baseplate assembly protein V [Pyxidicoccus xibeiensis]|uniref:phage baseplate assembly protein V n=1 Tax=Pyxidicoccus xibeiensis TaxID=2906759 RepID=UPI0020A72415|nr:phage baseplate assembly protein V [Pyxidicoccus xibeiensis]MCP3137406.1 phage baseplate assembly protein V [Pyxidicoccus xibeiensis]
MNRYFGKFRGRIVNNVDPLMLGRVQVGVPAVLGDGTLSWAMPCTPFAGPQVGMFALPPVGANVWVEFEGGDPDYPIWTGCFWGTGEVPAQPAIEAMKVFKTNGVTLTVNELPGAGGVTLEVMPPVVATPLKIVLGPSGIEISNGAAKIALTPASVSINDGALEVV